MAQKKVLILNNGNVEQMAATDQLPAANIANGTASNGFVPKSNGDGTATWAADSTGSGASGPTIGKVFAMQRGFFAQ
jgi:hypothetical protein